jgi:hypothetical protein
MTRVNAIKAARLLAAKHETHLGRCIWESPHRDKHVWFLMFAVEEYPPEWACFVSVNDLNSPHQFFAMRRPPRLIRPD